VPLHKKQAHGSIAVSAAGDSIKSLFMDTETNLKQHFEPKETIHKHNVESKAKKDHISGVLFPGDTEAHIGKPNELGQKHFVGGTSG
jgi:hypothetical protein